MFQPLLDKPAPTIAALQEWSVAQKKKQEETIGQRLARIRRERGLTQVELAAKIGVAQPVLSDYERGVLRLHGQLIVTLTNVLGVSSEELLGLSKPAQNSTIKNRRLLRRFQEIEKLPKRDQQALFRTIDAFLRSSPAA
ncbi:MAG: helix-turn-helix transcriptional regulator [Vicinamibacteria bacterium]|jgi:transcriptional regulator with XRE-family HTH domain|nr:helix-turn-helix transcriptional regulator [Vicinamibacteria bacterium]MBP9944829.1 helix-turn-helix transcriptional regulator [Vicinamibacteria bacterium]